MKLHVFVKASLAALFTGSLLFSFQNCSNAVNHGSNANSHANKDLEMGGNGSGYDGKVYVARGVCGGVEQAPKHVLEISGDGQHAQMLREECSKIDPRPIPVAEIQISSENPDVLAFNGSTYMADATESSTGRGLTKRMKRQRKWLKFLRSVASESRHSP